MEMLVELSILLWKVHEHHKYLLVDKRFLKMTDLYVVKCRIVDKPESQEGMTLYGNNKYYKDLDEILNFYQGVLESKEMQGQMKLKPTT